MAKERWEDFEREDLNCIPKMEALGFYVKYDYKDIWACRTNPGNPPHDPVYFASDLMRVWRIKEGWSGARIKIVKERKTSYYVGHVKADTPMEAAAKLESQISANV